MLKKIMLFAILLVTSFNDAWAELEEQGPLVIFSAASTAMAMDEIVNLYTARGLGHAVTSYAASSALAMKIAEGAPADIFISANTAWMDFLEAKELLKTGSRSNLLGNKMVLIASVSNKAQDMGLNTKVDLVSMLGRNGRFAIAEFSQVPAGIYGKAALQSIGAWDGIKNHLAITPDVRIALLLVARGEATLGVVYATDAVSSEAVRILGVFPEEAYPKIIYQMAIMKYAKDEEAERFMKFMRTPDVKAIFDRYGFTVF